MSGPVGKSNTFSGHLFLVGLPIHPSPRCQSLLMWHEGCGFYPQGTRFQGCPLLWCWGGGQKMPSYSWSSWCWAHLLVLGPQTSCPLSYDLPEFPFGCNCASCRASSPSELNMQGKQVYTVPSSHKFWLLYSFTLSSTYFLISLRLFDPWVSKKCIIYFPSCLDILLLPFCCWLPEFDSTVVRKHALCGLSSFKFIVVVVFHDQGLVCVGQFAMWAWKERISYWFWGECSLHVHLILLARMAIGSISFLSIRCTNGWE